MTDLSEFTDAELRDELDNRFRRERMRLWNAMTEEEIKELHVLAMKCGEESHEDGINCLPCEAWDVIWSRDLHEVGDS